MIVVILRCQMCGKEFEAKVLDECDPSECDRPGRSIRCDKCNSIQLERVRVLRRVPR